ncbi:MAG: hypothetical protein EO766_11995 [Hydrotalea sp. AMD]|uniref:hypothetical protein n=1 Tax=Hydrotalea sp. AMD TaxID=2501297 RepID=UPI0010252058|nr:hypothetical protein [Hydrotalea sp. AMD]RWZ87241.1 MAG: hypothetical protein EO766_11995 [Hydrotalea sp. AMD]
MASFEVKVYPIFIKDHPNADRLDLGNIGSPEGWQVVIAKGRFQTGDLVAYIGENAVVPDDILKYYGYWNENKDIGMLAGSKGNRVKAIRLRDAFSLGIVLPIVECKEGWYKLPHTPEEQYTGYFKLDEDVSEILGVTKYEPPIPTHMAGEVCNLIGYTLKFDIENYKKYPTLINHGEEVIFTEKIHGCVSPDTNIMLPNGEEIEIEEIISNQNYTHVLSFDIASHQYQSKLITGRSRRENIEKKRWVKLTMENGRTIKITEDHPIFSKDRQEYVEAKDITNGEDIESPF